MSRSTGSLSADRDRDGGGGSGVRGRHPGGASVIDVALATTSRNMRLPEEGTLRVRPLPHLLQVFTTTEYMPRLRERLCLEQQLAEDAATATRGWPREVEWHNSTIT